MGSARRAAEAGREGVRVQSTRPQTLAYGLTDSPVGQPAWVMDKFREWTRPRSTLPEQVVDRDRLLTNVMLNWLTRTAGSAAYVGYAQEAAWGRPGELRGADGGRRVRARRRDPPLRGAGEHHHPLDRRRPRRSLRGAGGPETLADDVREFFRPLR